MKDGHLTDAEIKIFYLKRWTAINVKLMRIEDVIKESSSETTTKYLKEYSKQLQTVKIEDKAYYKKAYAEN